MHLERAVESACALWYFLLDLKGSGFTVSTLPLHNLNRKLRNQAYKVYFLEKKIVLFLLELRGLVWMFGLLG